MNRIVKKTKFTTFKFSKFSQKQLQILTWWLPNTKVSDNDGIIADGAIRSGKTLSMSLSFVLWAMNSFNDQNFGMCGKTIGSFRRNVLFSLKLMLKARGLNAQELRSDNLLIVSVKDVTNYFYIFGGKDEKSQDLIQGITLAGCFFDEVALMPESFVNQAMGRCSVDGSKYWFNCNPEGPFHWFKTEIIDKKYDRNLLYIHFTMDDNLSLSEKIKQRYKRNFSGLFFKRYILGLWVLADGLIYDMFSYENNIVLNEERKYMEYCISCDYGIQNPMVFLLWGKFNKRWYCVKEYYYDGRNKGIQKTDGDYYEDLIEFANNYQIKSVVIDPSATSFIALIRKEGKFQVRKAKNDVLYGINRVATALQSQTIVFNDCCINTLKEFATYTWDEKAVLKGEDKPLKINDHAMDACRYFVNTIVYIGAINFA